MGGRGSTGSSVKAGAGFKIPQITGSEKQVAYATDILKKPYDSMIANAKYKEEFVAKYGGEREAREADAFRAAAKRYATEIAKLPDMPASKIIDKRSGLHQIAHNILKDEYKKHGFMPYEAPRNLF